MRFNQEVRFYSEGKRRYDPQASQYEGGPELVADVMGVVTDVGTDRTVKLFGSIVQGVKAIRLIEPIDIKWSYLTIGDDSTKYRLRNVTEPLKNVSMLVGEDVGKDSKN